MTIRVLCYILVLLATISSATLAQETKPGSSMEKPQDAFIKILNACDTAQGERWRTGLDLRFKDRTIGSDIRIGERGPHGKISFTGKDFIEVFRHGADTLPLARVPANLKPGGAYALVVLGQLDAGSAKLDVRIVEEYPLPDEDQLKGSCRLQLLNAVEKYPIAIGINKEKSIRLPFGELREFVFSPGAIDIGLFFSDSRGVTRRLQSGMVAEKGGNYTAVIFPSAERSDRPDIVRYNAASERPKIQAHDEESMKVPQ